MKSANQKMLALASAMTIGAIVAQHARAATFNWTRGSTTSSNWSNAANWTSPDGTPPPPPAALDNDLVYAGTPLSSGNNTQNGDYNIRSITIDPTFNVGAGGSLNFSVSSSVPSELLTLGSGGI